MKGSTKLVLAAAAGTGIVAVVGILLWKFGVFDKIPNLFKTPTVNEEAT